MSRYENDPCAALFESLDFGFATTFPMDGVEVVGDKELGEEFRNNAIAAREDIVRGFGLRNGEPFSDRAAARLQSQLDRLPRIPGSVMQPDQLVGVSGNGLILAKEYGVENYDIEVLIPASNLFGHLEGIGYNDYPYVEGIEKMSPDSRVELEVKNREGLVMVLGSAMICAADGYGQLEGKYEYALVPLTEPGLVIHKAVA